MKKVYEKKCSKLEYILMVVRNIFSIVFVKQSCILFAFYLINYIHGRRMAKIGKNCHISPTVLMRYPERIIIGNECLLNHNNILQAGKQSAVIKLGDYVMCGPNVSMFAYNHGMENSDIPMIKQPYMENDIIIEDDVWIGAGSIILAGAKINKGVVVAAGSIVTGELPTNSICGGVPAKVIKMRG
ncbi:MAG: Transferase hexapeptide repeat containing protein [Candidatus Uhrbacteria bacterium GW2011_GWF2_39_13]|uniref:Transferase hexapeptide repeat containing protein n=1 Tax=Candidatus Uhrbacteria bacterium GW2011_GWF2_39_13 TaxID=1618995 RepID=A0A0G0PY10_9BACT|nr:MAG: Transferase hexapeptide repeat containing protein [Candidatus Uhrbacteria bacterium GW2011_GWF2_39_13]